MNFDQFTVKVKEAITESQALAAKNSNAEIGSEHLMYCFLEQENGIDIGCSKALNRLTAVGTALRFISYMSQLLAAIRTNFCFANEVLIAYFPFRNYILIK